MQNMKFYLSLYLLFIVFVAQKKFLRNFWLSMVLFVFLSIFFLLAWYFFQLDNQVSSILAFYLLVKLLS